MKLLAKYSLKVLEFYTSMNYLSGAPINRPKIFISVIRYKHNVIFRFPAQKHLADLQKRLDTTERTMHLVMKQMEAVTKCLARTLENDPAGDATEINDGLKVMKESNV